jgi:DNA-binding CsgD family transcriptional regulator
MDHEALVATGQWRQFRARFAAEDRSLRKAHRWAEVTRLHALDLTVAGYRGEFDRERYNRLRQQAADHDDPETAGLLDRAAGLDRLAAGDAEAAWRVLRNLTEPLELMAASRAYVDVVRAGLAVGERGEVLRMLSYGPRLAARSMTMARVWHAQALWNCQGGATDPEPFFERALRSPLTPREPMEHGQMLLDHGRLLRSRRREEEARTALREALTRFEWLTAAPWAAQARAELRAAGVRVCGDHAPPAADALTPHSRRILRLAAEGLSNRAIAERLSLSPRTVATHLYRAFPLIGVRSRHELPKLFAECPSALTP